MSPMDSQPSANARLSAPTYLYVAGMSGFSRMKISPVSPRGSILPSGENASISPPIAMVPTEPRCASHSAPFRIVAATPSVPPYNSHTTSVPSHLIHSSFSHGGHGAARCQSVFNDDTSYLLRTSSG